MMSINPPIPDYELADRIVVTTPAQLRAMADPLRVTILDLLLERAATVAELAAVVQRPKSTVAHHVNVLLEAGLLRVVRTRLTNSARSFVTPASQRSARRSSGSGWMH